MSSEPVSLAPPLAVAFAPLFDPFLGLFLDSVFDLALPTVAIFGPKDSLGH